MLLDALLHGEWDIADAAAPATRRDTSGLVAAHLQWHMERQLARCPRWSGGPSAAQPAHDAAVDDLDLVRHVPVVVLDGRNGEGLSGLPHSRGASDRLDADHPVVLSRDEENPLAQLSHRRGKVVGDGVLDHRVRHGERAPLAAAVRRKSLFPAARQVSRAGV